MNSRHDQDSQLAGAAPFTDPTDESPAFANATIRPATMMSAEMDAGNALFHQA